MINDSILSDTRFLEICNDFGVLKNKPISYGRGLSCWADVTLLWCMWAQGQDRGGDKVIQRSVNQDGQAGGKPHPPHSSSIKTEEEEDVDETDKN